MKRIDYVNIYIKYQHYLNDYLENFKKTSFSMGELHYFRFLDLLAGQMPNKTQTMAASLLGESAAAFTLGLLALCSYTCHLDFQTELLRRQTLKLELRS